jgi:hypothetical protein
MLKLREAKNHGVLIGKEDYLEPVHRNKTRWSSAFNMIERYLYFEGKEFFLNQREWFNRLYDPDELDELQIVYNQLKKLDSVTKRLQGEGERVCSHSEVRQLFDAVIDSFPSFEDHCSSGATIVTHKEFENGLVKLQKGEETTLSQLEKQAMRVFLSEEAGQADIEEEVDSFAESILLANKRRRVSLYTDTKWVPSTTAGVERLFSLAKQVRTDQRSAMLPKTLEILMYLRLNQSLWNISTVSKIVTKGAIVEV